MKQKLSIRKCTLNKTRNIVISVTSGMLIFYAFMFMSNEAFAQSKADFDTTLNIKIASKLASLPLKCMDKQYPYKTTVVYGDSSRVTTARNYQPAFYGCFDWHSSVHGHWMLIKLLKEYPGLPENAAIRRVMNAHLTKENIEKELLLFLSKDNKDFERTYGWAWLLQLQHELLTWNDPDAKRWAQNTQPLADQLSKSLVTYLGKLVYPIRSGDHFNLAFALRLSFDYATTVHDTVMLSAIKKAAIACYLKDKNYSFRWEPSGNDFLSPCLEEAALMTRILSAAKYKIWLKGYLPELFSPSFILLPGKVIDRTDGKLVHLDGLNLSRAWCLKEIYPFIDNAAKPGIEAIINDHLKNGLEHVMTGNYEGEHWLASFAVYVLTK